MSETLQRNRHFASSPAVDPSVSYRSEVGDAVLLAETPGGFGDVGDLRATGVEWQTLALAVAIYGGTVATLLASERLGALSTIALLAWFGAWFGSLQHECIHGHPFASQRLNDALAWPPLALWLSYRLYRDTHRRHHRNAILTDPFEDPETKYFDPDVWASTSRAMRFVHRVNGTLLGRVVIGPILLVVRTVPLELRSLRTPAERRRFALHLVGALTVVAGVGATGTPLWVYLAGFVYGGASLTMIRTFAEHRYVPGNATRSATVHAGVIWRLLFLNNNFHHAHHYRPSVPWYRVPELSTRIGAADISARGAGRYEGYGELFRRFLLRPGATITRES